MSKASKPSLATELLGVTLASPVLNASGTFGLGGQEIDGFNPSCFGAVVTKTVALLPIAGNLNTVRLWESHGGLINRVGLEGPGIEVFMAEKLPCWLELGVPVIVNISGSRIDEFVTPVRRLRQSGIIAIEVNLSCPNVEKERLVFSTDPAVTRESVSRLVAVAEGMPLIIKLTPNVTDIGLIAKVAQEAGARAISATNTFKARRYDIRTGKLIIEGGFSGPPIMPQALQKVWEICQAVTIPVIGMGGISSGEEAIEFFLAGASAVAVGTAGFTQPVSTVPRIVEGISKWLEEHHFSSFEEFRNRIKETGSL